jgi:hypothetical protein
MTDGNEESDIPPGDDADELYEPTGLRGTGRGSGLIWFRCADASRDRLFPLAILRTVHPGKGGEAPAVLKFSGEYVELKGTDARKVINRIFLGRCNIVYEIRDGQQPKKKDDAIITKIKFWVPKQQEDEEQGPKPRKS